MIKDIAKIHITYMAILETVNLDLKALTVAIPKIWNILQ